MDDKLCLAPLSNPQNVLDIATGTGIWAIEFGKLTIPYSNSTN
jgi:ubiquinone/menaquinone biosynthesis C-methylase UbiE